MFEVIRWISLVALWACIAAYIWLFFRNRRLAKAWKESMERMEQMYNQYKEMRDKYIELLSEQWEEVSDGRND